MGSDHNCNTDITSICVAFLEMLEGISLDRTSRRGHAAACICTL